MRPSRIVALGASNLTRGFPSVVDAARRGFGAPMEVLTALGLGRSYGMDSRILGRTLPGILQCGLWRALDTLPPAPTRALVTDVGNDIGYGTPPAQILEWVEEAVDRLQRSSAEVILAGLPLLRLQKLSRPTFLLARSVLFPSFRGTLPQVLDGAALVEEGLQALSRRRGLRFVPLPLEWYGPDPIHFRPGVWADVWGSFTCGAPPPGRRSLSVPEVARLYLAAPESRRVFGLTRARPQPALRLADGTTVWSF